MNYHELQRYLKQIEYEHRIGNKRLQRLIRRGSEISSRIVDGALPSIKREGIKAGGIYHK